MAIRRYDPEATRQAILEAAHTTFVAKGVADTPMSVIAKASGVTKSLIHHHFGSKEELWFEVKKAAFEPFFTGLLKIVEQDAPHQEVLEATIRHMFRFFQKHPDVARMMTWMRLEKSEVCMDLETEVTGKGMARIAEAQAAGLLRNDVTPASMQLTFIILTTGWFQLRHLAEALPECTGEQGCIADLEERYLEDMMRMFFQGIQPPA